VPYALSAGDDPAGFSALSPSAWGAAESAPMRGCPRFVPGPIALSGIGFACQITNQQFNLAAACSPEERAPEMWEALVAA
jgi:hypothetical protein